MRHEKPILIGQLFPNPPAKDGIVYLACVGHIPHPVAIRVRTAEGEVVFQAVHCLPSWGGTVSMDFSSLGPGVYEVVVICGEVVETRRLTIAGPPKKRNWFKWFSPLA